MKKYVNGEYIELTPAELAALEAEQANMPTPDPTIEERMAAMESAMLALMGGGSNV